MKLMTVVVGFVFYLLLHFTGGFGRSSFWLFIVLRRRRRRKREHTAPLPGTLLGSVSFLAILDKGTQCLWAGFDLQTTFL